MHWTKDKSSDRLALSLKPPAGSVFARAVGREQKPAWGNRFLRDFYDLEYNHPDVFSHLKGRQTNHPQKKAPREKKTFMGLSLSCHDPEKIAIPHTD
jgi:hypothetical protein